MQRCTDKYFFAYLGMEKTKNYTIGQFAKKIKVSRSTVWRWATEKEKEKYFKMYDARKILVAGKTFIEA